MSTSTETGGWTSQPGSEWELQPVIRGICHFLAHDLGNAVSAMSITLDLLATREDLPAPSRELVVRATGLQGRLLAVVDALGSLGGSRPRLQEVDLAAAIEPSLATMKLRDRFAVELDLDGAGSPARIHGDGNLLKLCLRLLLRNASEATPPGGRLGVRATRADGMIRLTVWDEGAGVPEEHRARLFRQAFSTRGGNGVALLVVRSAVEGTFHGRVGYAPNTPHGSCFILDLQTA